MPHKIHSCSNAQILARVKCASVCSSWIGVLKLFPQQGLGVLGNLQAFRSRYKASRTVKGASRPRPRPSGVTKVGGEGNSEVLGQTVVDWTVVGLNVGRWVSQSSVARRLLSSQTASKLSLAGWRVCFPDKVQLVQGLQAWLLPGEKWPGGQGTQSTPSL